MQSFVSPGILCGVVFMRHDIEDLLEIIRELEKRIIKLENQGKAERLVQHEDGWYWEYG